MSLETYDDAWPWAELMADYVEAKIMPPWGEAPTDDCQPMLAFRDDPTLTDDEIQLMRAWADAGAPEGDPDNAADIPEPPNWQLEDPDVVVAIEKPITIDGTEDRYLCTSVDPGNDTDVWITGTQLLPDNELIVHHSIFAVDESGSSAQNMGPNGYWECFAPPGLGGGMLGIWTPGMPPVNMPPDTGLFLPAGARLVVQFHYHPTGVSPEVDQSEIALKWRETEPFLKSRFELVGNIPAPLPNGNGLQPGPNDDDGVEFKIPANVKDHTETMLYALPDQLPAIDVWAVGPHMHYLGVDATIKIKKKGGGEECLISTPRYGFDWQRIYEYDGDLAEVPQLAGGDTVWLQCEYDNTIDNPYVQRALEEAGLDEPIDVYMGESTLDEMCIAMIGVTSFF